jgi:hypothetical protein
LGVTLGKKTGIALISIFVSGCNLFGGLDKPSGDTQVLSAARACFDQGNFECSSKYYSQLSPSASDQGFSESAFELLAQTGITVSDFMDAVISGESNAGKLITRLSNGIVPSAGESTRLAIFQAYKKISSIQDTRTKGLIRFVTSISLMAAILAEDAGATGTLQRIDLVKDPTLCLNSTPVFTPTLTISGCDRPTGKKIISGSTVISLPTATDQQISGSPSLQMINAAVNEIDHAIIEMDTIGDLGSSSSKFTSDILSVSSYAIDGSTDSPLYRKMLIQYDIGTN